MPAIAGTIAPGMSLVTGKYDWEWPAFLNFGEARYPLRRPLFGKFFFQGKGMTLHACPEGGWTRQGTPKPGATEIPFAAFRLFFGRGKTQSEAITDFEGKFHVAFQRLFCKRPFQMRLDEKAIWDILEKLVDVDAYWKEAPLDGREIGEIKRLSENRLEIKFIDGRHERLPIEKTPAGMAALLPGEWFEAITRRNPGDGKMLKILWAQRMPPIKPMNKKEAQEYWDKMPRLGQADPPQRLRSPHEQALPFDPDIVGGHKYFLCPQCAAIGKWSKMLFEWMPPRIHCKDCALVIPMGFPVIDQTKEEYEGVPFSFFSKETMKRAKSDAFIIPLVVLKARGLSRLGTRNEDKWMWALSNINDKKYYVARAEIEMKLRQEGDMPYIPGDNEYG
jgi:hypothetical protein